MLKLTETLMSFVSGLWSDFPCNHNNKRQTVALMRNSVRRKFWLTNSDADTRVKLHLSRNLFNIKYLEQLFICHFQFNPRKIDQRQNYLSKEFFTNKIKYRSNPTMHRSVSLNKIDPCLFQTSADITKEVCMLTCMH